MGVAGGSHGRGLSGPNSGLNGLSGSGRYKRLFLSVLEFRSETGDMVGVQREGVSGCGKLRERCGGGGEAQWAWQRRRWVDMR